MISHPLDYPPKNGLAHRLFCVTPTEPVSPVLRKIARILEQRILARCPACAVGTDGASLNITLSVQAGMAPESYRIESNGDRCIRILGGCERGVLYGAGKFLRTSRYEPAGFLPGLWRGESAPKRPFRAIYLATHFHNFYEAAPREDVDRYIQDLGLWGYNAVIIHYPTSQLTGLDDPASKEWFLRFKAVLAEARSCGLQVGLIQVANQCFMPAPPELAFTKMTGQSNAGSGVCISKPAGKDLVVRIYQELLDEFRDVGLDVFILGPYDDGGCGCPDCWPWGSKGFVNISRELSSHVRARHPGCRIVLHTWCFESENDSRPLGEWEGLDARLKKDRSWLDYIMADGHDDYFPKYPMEIGVPGNLPLVNFPEISMFGASPWGGYGANPAPAHFQRLWDRIKSSVAGGMPYSEGIYEDINKAIIARFYWDENQDAGETVREYASFEFAPEASDRVLKLVRILEENLPRNSIKSSARDAFAIAKEVDAMLAGPSRLGWRWRVLYLRALIDREMFDQPKDVMSVAAKDAFAELTRMYHADHAVGSVKPPEDLPREAGRLGPRHSPFVTTWHISELQPPSDLSSVGPASRADALNWQRVVEPWFTLEKDFVSVHDHLGTRDGLAYLSNRFAVEKTGEWILHLGHDGGVKVFVDGRDVLCESTRINPAPTSRSKVRVRLEQGTREIVVAFDTDQGRGWGMFFCFERPDGSPDDVPFPLRMD